MGSPEFREHPQLVADAAAREMPRLAALEAIRKGQRHGLRRDDVRSSDVRARDYDPGRGVSAIEAESLLEAARALIEAVRAGARRFPEGRRD